MGDSVSERSSRQSAQRKHHKNSGNRQGVVTVQRQSQSINYYHTMLTVQTESNQKRGLDEVSGEINQIEGQGMLRTGNRAKS